MHIIGIILSIAAGAAFWYWRMKMIRDAGSKVIDSVQKMRGAMKRRSFRRKAETAPLDSIKDPAIAAMTFYAALAAEKPAYRQRGLDRAREAMSGILAEGDIEEVVVFSEWAAQGVVDPVGLVRRFRSVWLDALDHDERKQLLDIAGEVSAVGGTPTPDQENALAQLRNTLFN
ncbi:MAG: hypothetical protein VYD64_01730 [Pseudomonadota bacterium]|nr:hypothetical protein [Pseudomonadota bacterium]